MLKGELLIFIVTFQGYRADHEPGDEPVDESSANEEYNNEGRVESHGKSCFFASRAR